jgi:hypothetical protein
MKLELLLIREINFWEDLNNYVAKHRQVFLKLGLISGRIKDFVVYDPKLNLVFNPKEKSHVAASSVLDEAFDKSLFRQLLRKIYIFLRSSRLSIAYFLPRKELDFCLEEGITLLPGNHSYRFFDVRAGKFFVFSKEGYCVEPAEYLTKKKNFLVDSNILLFDSLIVVQEDYFSGKPLNRQRKISRSDILPLINQIEEFAPESTTTSSLLLAQLIGAFDCHLSNLNDKIGRQLLIRLLDIRNIIEKRIKEHPDIKINLSFSHGDFQPANILVGEHEIKIIDWEYAGLRVKNFDEFTLLSSVRTAEAFYNSKFFAKYSDIEVHFFIFSDLLVRLDELTPNYVSVPLSSFSTYISKLEVFLDA